MDTNKTEYWEKHGYYADKMECRVRHGYVDRNECEEQPGHDKYADKKEYDHAGTDGGVCV